LQIDNDLASVGKRQSNHIPNPLVVDVGLRFIINAVTSSFNQSEHCLSAIQEFGVGHYNFTMLKTIEILVKTYVLGFSMLILGACGQTGALYLPASSVPTAKPSTAAPAQRLAITTTTP
jgi:predicted small lipoprotein YifL